MKKNSFMQGAFIATLGIVLSKILGIIYVIPFYAIIGEQGGALYGYAYSIYSIFLGISQAGIPLAISKIVSEYNVLGYYNAKRRTFKLGKKVLSFLGIICFLIMFIFARWIAILIIGNVSGGNTIEDVTFVVRVIASAVLIVPILSIYRGYLQGHKFIAPTSISQVLEQIVRVLVIIFGSYLTLNVLGLSLTTAVGVAVFSATVGALTSYFYLVCKTKKNKKELEKETLKVEEPKITDKEIIEKILIYAFPFIMIDVFKSLINSVDVFMLVKVLVNGIGYTATDAEAIMSVVSTWGQKINMIIASISTGLMVSLIPHLTASFVKKDMEDVKKKINQTIQWSLFFTIPMTFGLSVLAKPVWTFFYGVSEFGPSVYQYYVFVALATTLFTASVTILQLLKEYKQVFICLLTGLLTNALLNIPLLYAFHNMGLPAYYGSTTSTILGYFACSYLALRYIGKKYKISYEETIKRVINIFLITLVMVICLLIMKYIFPITTTSKILNMLYVLLFSGIGVVIYFTIMFKSRLVYDIFGRGNIEKILNKLKRR